MTSIRKLAEGQPCLVRLPGCLGQHESVVLAHYRLSGLSGMGIKPPDYIGAWACSSCHDICDGRVKPPNGLTRLDVRMAHADGVFRTLRELDRMGVL